MSKFNFLFPPHSGAQTAVQSQRLHQDSEDGSHVVVQKKAQASVCFSINVASCYIAWQAEYGSWTILWSERIFNFNCYLHECNCWHFNTINTFNTLVCLSVLLSPFWKVLIAFLHLRQCWCLGIACGFRKAVDDSVFVRAASMAWWRWKTWGRGWKSSTRLWMDSRRANRKWANRSRNSLRLQTPSWPRSRWGFE